MSKPKPWKNGVRQYGDCELSVWYIRGVWPWAVELKLGEGVSLTAKGTCPDADQARSVALEVAKYLPTLLEADVAEKVQNVLRYTYKGYAKLTTDTNNFKEVEQHER